LDGYDYTKAGAYFVTVCVEGHTCLLGDIMDAEMRLNDAGCMVKAAWDELPDHYPGVETDAFVVMPNHIHAIIVLAPVPPLAVGAGPRACPNEIDSRGGHGGQLRPDIGQPQGVAPTNLGRMLSLAEPR